MVALEWTIWHGAVAKIELWIDDGYQYGQWGCEGVQRAVQIAFDGERVHVGLLFTGELSLDLIAGEARTGSWSWSPTRLGHLQSGAAAVHTTRFFASSRQALIYNFHSYSNLDFPSVFQNLPPHSFVSHLYAMAPSTARYRLPSLRDSKWRE